LNLLNLLPRGDSTGATLPGSVERFIGGALDQPVVVSLGMLAEAEGLVTCASDVLRHVLRACEAAGVRCLVSCSGCVFVWDSTGSSTCMKR
jgi:hypothetical protein